jgi:hypothetical protein
MASLLLKTLDRVSAQREAQTTLVVRLYANSISPIWKTDKETGEKVAVPGTAQIFANILPCDENELACSRFDEGDSIDKVRVKLWASTREYAPEGVQDPLKEGLFGARVTGILDTYKIDDRDKHGTVIAKVRQINASRIEYFKIEDEEEEVAE